MCEMPAYLGSPDLPTPTKRFHAEKVDYDFFWLAPDRWTRE